MSRAASGSIANFAREVLELKRENAELRRRIRLARQALECAHGDKWWPCVSDALKALRKAPKRKAKR